MPSDPANRRPPNQAALGSSFDLPEPEFEIIRQMVKSKTGISLGLHKRDLVVSRLARRLRSLGLESFREYIDLLRGDQDGGELVHMINRITTNKTDFFREPKHFEYMESTVLPAIKAAGIRRLRAWSAGCSTGAEAYTMAMVFDDFAMRNGGPEYGILATDLDSDVLEAARRGIYPRALLDPTPAAMRKRYVMEPVDRRSGDVRIVPALRSAIGFAQLNFMDANYPVGNPMDIILCRNVLIYFDRPTQEAVLGRLCRNLKPGGWIMLGHSETIADMQLPLRQVGFTTFQKV